MALTGSAQLVLARAVSRSYLRLQNISTHAMAVEIGFGRAHCALTNGAVSSVTIDNGGFNYTNPPLVRFLGGGFNGNSSNLGLNQPNWPGPNSAGGLKGRPAQGHAVLTAGAISSVVIDDPGQGYAIAPFVQFIPSALDPYGCALPAVGSAGFQLAAGASLSFEATTCPTDSVAVIGTMGDVLICRWLD